MKEELQQKVPAKIVIRDSVVCPPIGKASLVDGQVEGRRELKQWEPVLLVKGRWYPGFLGWDLQPLLSAQWSLGGLEGSGRE